MSKVGVNVRKHRIAIGMTQSELAEKLGYSKSAITKIETGINDLPISKLCETARALHTTPHELIGW